MLRRRWEPPEVAALRAEFGMSPDSCVLGAGWQSSAGDAARDCVRVQLGPLTIAQARAVLKAARDAGVGLERRRTR